MNGIQDPNQKLKAAVRSEHVPPFLDVKIRAAIGSSGNPRRFLVRLAPLVSAAALVIVLVVSYQLGHLRMTVHSQQSYIASVSNRVATLMRVGLQDHIHCTVFRKYPKVTPTAQEFVKKMGPKYSGLIPILQRQISSDYRLVIAHECGYDGRKFVHLSMMNAAHQMSLVITLKRDGESFDTEGMLPALVQSGIPMYQAGVQRFQISAFETRDHLAYFVSDLPRDKNAELMVAIAPQVKTFLNAHEL
jgi:hypothetical protein